MLLMLLYILASRRLLRECWSAPACLAAGKLRGTQLVPHWWFRLRVFTLATIRTTLMMRFDSLLVMLLLVTTCCLGAHGPALRFGKVAQPLEHEACARGECGEPLVLDEHLLSDAAAAFAAPRETAQHRRPSRAPRPVKAQRSTGSRARGARERVVSARTRGV